MTNPGPVDFFNTKRPAILIFTHGRSLEIISYLRALAANSQLNVTVANFNPLTTLVSRQFIGTLIRTWKKIPKEELVCLVKKRIGDLDRRRNINHPILLKKYYFLTQILRSFILWMSYFHYLRVHPYAMLGVWNGTKFEDIILRMVANYIGLRMVCFEHGILPNTTTLDDRGINDSNSLPQNPRYYLKHSAASVRLPTGLQTRTGGKREITSFPLPSNYIFVPFQINGDSQILDHSPWIKNMQHFFFVLRSVMRQADDKNLYCIIKQHPQCSRNYSKLHTIAKQEKQILFSDHSTEELIKKAKVVVTINSTVGMEALLFVQKVITLGHTYYNLPDLVRHADTRNELLIAINNIAKWRPNERLRKAFLDYVYRYYCIPEDWHHPSAKHFRAIDRRLEKMLKRETWLPL